MMWRQMDDRVAWCASLARHGGAPARATQVQLQAGQDPTSEGLPHLKFHHSSKHHWIW